MVDRDGLENRCGCKLTVGSNPTLSANSLGFLWFSGPFSILSPTLSPTPAAARGEGGRINAVAVASAWGHHAAMNDHPQLPTRSRRSPGEILAGSKLWHSWSPARQLLFCAMVPLQFALAFIATVVIGVVALSFAGLIH